jgi:DNA modification methylase
VRASTSRPSAKAPDALNGFANRLLSPKLPGGSHLTADASWYRYYAGFPPEFVDQVLEALDVGSSRSVLDPWNGAGTTTLVASERGLDGVGFDINPVSVLIAKGRSLTPSVSGSLAALTNDLRQKGRHGEEGLGDDDPLLDWFDRRTAARFRHLERGITRLLVDQPVGASVSGLVAVDDISSLASFFYVVLFEVVRGALVSRVGSNPTWIKKPAKSDRLGLGYWEIDRRFAETSWRLTKYIVARPERLQTGDVGALRIGRATSTELPIDDRSVDIVVSSPPYCTRIDYVVSTLPELAVLGYRADALRSLRDQMIGTPTMSGTQIRLDESWGDTVNKFVNRVAEHESKASAVYYKKYFLQYFAGMWRSLGELRRVLKNDGTAVLVVQDSYYKDIHNDLAGGLTEMALNSGWSKASRIDFAAPRTMAMLNPGARAYRSNIEAVETVLVLSGGG